MDLKIPLLVTKTLHVLIKAGFDAYIVGGAVRDVLMGKAVTDWDFTTNATPQQLTALFPESFYDNQFGTVGITVEHLCQQYNVQASSCEEDNLTFNEVFQITTYRTEGQYSDNRRPDFVNWGKSLEEDLQRRDFTVNAMAITIKPSNQQGEYEVIDLYQGKEDLKNKIIRAVGNPDERFSEDALRMLRAVRFGAQLGFTIETKTLEAITNNAQRLKNISQERIRDELLKILASPYQADGIRVLLSTGLLQYILPELLETIGVEQAGHHTKDVWHHSLDALAACPSPDPVVRLATLLHDIGKPKAFRKNDGKITFYGHEVVGSRIAKDIARRLHLSNSDIDKVWTLVRYHMFAYNREMTDAAIRRFIRNVGLANINDMIMLRIGDRVGGGSRQTSWRLRELQERIGQVLYTPMQVSDLKVNGKDIMDVLGIPPGPKVGEILQTLFDEVMEESAKNDREYLLKRIKEVA